MPEKVEKRVVYLPVEMPELRLPPKGTKWKCSGCGVVKEATEENFEPTPVTTREGKHYILRRRCRMCRRSQDRDYKVTHASYISAARKIARQIKAEGGEI